MKTLIKEMSSSPNENQTKEKTTKLHCQIKLLKTNFNTLGILLLKKKKKSKDFAVARINRNATKTKIKQGPWQFRTCRLDRDIRLIGIRKINKYQ